MVRYVTRRRVVSGTDTDWQTENNRVQKSYENPKLDESITDDGESVLRQIPIDWQTSVSRASVRYTNQVTVQPVEQQLLLTFFMVVPPMAIGSAAEVYDQLEKVDSVVPECLARILVNKQTVESLITILQSRLEELKKSEKSNETEL